MRDPRPHGANTLWPIAAALVAVALGGCRREPLLERLERFATPSGALASADSELVALVRGIDAQRGLSSQLDGPRGPDAENAAAALAAAYSRSLHSRLGSSAEGFAGAEAALAARREFLDRHGALVEKTAAAIDLPRFRFAVGHRYGFFARMLYLDDASLAARLMVARSLQRAGGGDPAGSVADMMRAMRVAHELADVRRVEARVLAAALRQQALAGAEAAFAAELYTKFEAEQLYGLLRDQLADWPAEPRMLVGERATVIHAYEAIRDGMLDGLVVAEERNRLREGGLYAPLVNATAGEIDADEARYLRAVEGLIDAAALDEPSGKKVAIERAIAGANESSRLFAALLFLPDVPDALRRSAEDRARVEAWAIALSAAAELKETPFRVSPLSGAPYAAERSPQGVAVSYGPADANTIALPLLAP